MNNRISAHYPYRDKSGKLLYEQVRFEPKSFRFRRPDGKGGWIWDLHGVKRVLYNLPKISKAKEIYVVEGEKDAETLRAWKLVATCNPSGAGKWKDDYSEVLKGKSVVVLQDADEPGKKHAQAVALSIATLASETKLLPPFPDANDITEWKAQGGTKTELLKLVDDAPLFTVETNSAPVSSDSISGTDRVLSDNDWRMQPLDGHLVISMLEGFFSRYLILPTGLPLVLSIWAMGTHIFDIFDTFPYLAITSPTKRCGKTRVAEVLELFVKHPLSSVNISEAALFRSIAAYRPTVLIDEAEPLTNRKSERTQYLLALLQAGFKQGASVPRCVGKDFRVEQFPVFCPKVVLAIGNLPDTLLDRSIHIHMHRRKANQEVEQFRRRRAKQEADGPLHSLQEWLKCNRDAVAKAYAKQSVDFLLDREADLWEPLFAIASAAIPRRTEELKRTTLRLSGEKKDLDTDESDGARLLGDIRTVFEASKPKKIDTGQLIFKLTALPESAWGDELTPIKLARMLRPFEVSSRQLWIDDRNRRGYDYEDFTKAFESYVPNH